jgi:hypothetical protein
MKGERINKDTAPPALDQTPLAPPKTGRPGPIETLFSCSSSLAFVWWIGFSLVMFFSFLHSYNQDRRAYQEKLDTYVTVQATVVKRETGGLKGEDLYLTYQFDAPRADGQGEPFTRIERVGRKTYDALALGDTVTLLYPPGLPDGARRRSTLHPPGLAGVVMSGAFVLAGFLMLWGAWLMRKHSKQKAREDLAWLGALFGRRATAKGAVDGHGEKRRAGERTTTALRCEKCGRPLGPEVADCPEQAWGTCPYRVERPLEGTASRRNWGCLLVGLVVTLLGLALLLANLLPLAICVVALGVLVVALSLLALALPASDSSAALTVYNESSGQMWQRYSLSGLVARQITASALQPVTLEVGLRRPLQYPASISTLYQRQDASTIFYMALLSLASQGVIDLKHTLVSKIFLNLPTRTQRDFALSPGERMGQVRVKGELERRIVQTVRDWSGPETEQGRSRRKIHTRERTFTHFLALEDVMLLVIEGERSAPETWLVANLVGRDASAQGLGRVVRRLQKRFEPAPEYQARMRTEYEIVHQVHEAFNASQPGVASDLWRAVERAISMCTDVSD